MSENRWEPEKKFNYKKAKAIIGKTIVIGLTYYDHNGGFIEIKQMHGKIRTANNKEGVGVLLENRQNEGELFWLPNDLSAIKKAEKGIYESKNTGEVVEYPDYISTWEITKPGPEFQTEE